MAESAALRYLLENSTRYPKDVLMKNLKDAGYPESEIAAALKQLAQPLQPGVTRDGGFFDFKNKRFYKSVWQKVGDFAFGFFGFWVIGYIFSRLLYAFIPFRFFAYGPLALRFFPVLVSLGIFIGVIMYFWKRRRWISYGVLATFVIGFLLAGIVLLFLGFALRSFY
ncbi:MAG: hypothetical protein A2806_01520 [Candidatus Terrybacteria bacterium RIFCSPHIGHO2_01_FULL_48_17]|uniref:Uncharacterized protein n=1 Tax=Candidatus Terrybacteria bacterium RIFCSPHIGHO2_01_FULL_48_17 TaxID=1802362 RepID=A0A1G2PHI2_9BACT|nr:MAG: hypothetical protein A2806_01520 [Candidatus Terrybacteria bacterium RIFCSPHIGHO2_01_FULL_48_17]OHA52279.1 MAG: hypothetical protein A3A30_04780 [Candidatus Terrybacteria bacterium RIFCSPLOWO2_01_FULL_48_14]